MLPEKKYPLRLYYMFRDELCTIIDVDVKNKKIFRVEGNPSRKKFIEDTRMKFIS